MREIKVDKYYLTPLESVRQDDIKSLLSGKPGVYLCNFPDDYWYEKHELVKKKEGNILKKKQIFKLMGEGSFLLSWTCVEHIKKATKNLKNGSILHFGNWGFSGRIGQLIMTLKIIAWMIKNRRQFSYTLINNFYFPLYFASLFAKYFLGKELYVDFQDDYTLQERAQWKNKIFTSIKHTPDKVICINEHMESHFEVPGIETVVFNGFMDLSYTSEIDYTLKDGMRFMFGGKLDSIRGVDLLPDLIVSLRKEIVDFEVIIAGTGPMEKEMRSWEFPELNMVGFLSGKDYEHVLKEADAYLVLQKPDLPFSKGSYPSKIEYYSRFEKPIYHLKLKT